MAPLPAPMKSAVTLAQVPEAKAGSFVFHDPLPETFAKAAAIGFDAVELFLPGPHFIDIETVKSMSTEHDLPIAAVGTGAGMVQHGLSLTDGDASKRAEALDYVLSMIDFGGQLGAPAILGSMQGKWGGDISQEQSLEWLTAALRACDERAARHDTVYYGQLAARKLGRRKISMATASPSKQDRISFPRLELVQAIAKLESAGHPNKARVI